MRAATPATVTASISLVMPTSRSERRVIVDGYQHQIHYFAWLEPKFRCRSMRMSRSNTLLMVAPIAVDGRFCLPSI